MICIKTNGLSCRFSTAQLIMYKINLQVHSSSIHRFFGPGNLCSEHKSHMVVIDKIDSIEKNEIRIGEKLIANSDKYWQAIYEIIRSKDYPKYSTGFDIRLIMNVF